MTISKHFHNFELMLRDDLTKDIRDRLASIKGQVEGISKMLHDGKEPEQILVQFKAAQKGLDKAHYLLLDEVYRKTLALKIVESAEACPGNCGNEDKIEYLRKQFPNLKLEELTEKMSEIVKIKERLDEFNASPKS